MGRKDGGAVVLRHLLIESVEHRFCLGVFYRASLEVVWSTNANHSSEIPISVDMADDPGFLLHVQKSLCVGVSAVREHRHKQVGIQPLSCIRVHQRSGLPSPVHLHGLAGLVLQMHGGFSLVDIVCVVLVELSGFVGQFTALAALLTVFHPQQAQGDAALLYLTVYPPVVRHLVNRPL